MLSEAGPHLSVLKINLPSLLSKNNSKKQEEQLPVLKEHFQQFLDRLATTQVRSTLRV
jgi:hypothetical protein